MQGVDSFMQNATQAINRFKSQSIDNHMIDIISMQKNQSVIKTFK